MKIICEFLLETNAIFNIDRQFRLFSIKYIIVLLHILLPTSIIESGVSQFLGLLFQNSALDVASAYRTILN